MRARKVKELSVVEFEWVDSCHQAGWQYSREGYEFHPSRQRTVGIVVGCDRDSIVVSTTVGTKEERGRSDYKFSGVHTPFSIPWRSITKLGVIKKDAVR